MQFFTQDQLSEQLSISKRTLERFRSEGKGPKYYKMGRRVLYASKDVEEYLQEHQFGSTSEYRFRS